MSDQTSKGLNFNLNFPVKWKTYAQIIGLIMALTIAARFGLTINNVNVTADQVLEATNLQVGSSYSLFVKGSSYTIAHPLGDTSITCLQNGTTGKLDYYGTNASKVAQFAADNTTAGGLIWMKAGLYAFDTMVTVSHGATYFCGEGVATTDNPATTISYSGSGGACFKFSASSHQYFGGISNMQLIGSLSSNAIGVHVEKFVSDLFFEKVFVVNFYDNMRVESAGETIATGKVWNIWIRDCLPEGFPYSRYGIHVTNTTVSNYVENVKIDGCIFSGNMKGIVIDAYNAYNILITNNRDEQESQESIYISSGNRITISDNAIYNCGKNASNTYSGIYIGNTTNTYPSDINIHDNHIYNKISAADYIYDENMMRYAINLTGYMDNVNVHDNDVEYTKTVAPYEAIWNDASGYNITVRHNTGFVSPEDSSGSESIRVTMDGTYYYSKNCTSNMQMERSTNADMVINNALGNLSDGGSIYVEDTVWLSNPIIFDGSVGQPLYQKKFSFTFGSLVFEGGTQGLVFRNITRSCNVEGVELTCDGTSTVTNLITFEGMINSAQIKIQRLLGDWTSGNTIGINITGGTGDYFVNNRIDLTLPYALKHVLYGNLTGNAWAAINHFNLGWCEGSSPQEMLLYCGGTDSWHNNVITGSGGEISDWNPQNLTELYVIKLETSGAGNIYGTAFNDFWIYGAENASYIADSGVIGTRFVGGMLGNSAWHNYFYDLGVSTRFSNVYVADEGYTMENTVLNIANTTATTFVFESGCADTPNSVNVQFNFTGWTSWTWTAAGTQVTVTVTGTLPAAMEILAADCKYIP